MVAQATQQRDLIHKPFGAASIAATVDIAQDTGLTSCQIGYSLKPIPPWLAQREVVLKTTPGLATEILCSSARQSDLLPKLDSQTDFQPVYTPGQREQFLILCLLTAVTSLIPNWLQHIAAISRPTLLSNGGL